MTDSWLQNYAHDMKQFLLFTQSLLGRLEAINDSVDATGRALILKQLRTSLTRVLHLTSSLLLADKESAGRLVIKPLRTNLNDLVTATVDEFKPLYDQLGILLKVNSNSTIPEVSLDPAFFPSVIANLLDNSLKYSNPGDTVWISTSSNDRNVVLTISDSGIGIPPQERHRLFEPHFRASNVQQIVGVGLGLYLAKAIVTAHGGTIKLDTSKLNASADKPGTSFVITLPIESERAL